MLKKILLAAGAVSAFLVGAKALKKSYKMPLIGDDAPKFRAVTTKGVIDFPDDYRGKWVVLFSHPGDFTPVCTTEFMTFQDYADKFNELNTELIGLSVDSVVSHRNWLSSIRNRIKFKGMENVDVTFPVIDDESGIVAKKYGMLQNDSNSTKTVRAVFVIDNIGKIRAILYYPQSTGRCINEILRLVKALQTSDVFDVATPANWNEGDDVIIPPDKKPYQLNEDELKEEHITCHDWYLCTKPLSKNDINKALS